MNPTEIDRLAHAANALRPDWPTISVRTYLTTRFADRAYADVATALVVIAVDPASRTPKRLDQPGPWWQAAEAAGGAQNTPQPPSIRAYLDELARRRAHMPSDERRAAHLSVIRGQLHGTPQEQT